MARVNVEAEKLYEMQKQLGYSMKIMEKLSDLNFSEKITKPNTSIDEIKQYINFVKETKEKVSLIIFGILKSSNSLLKSADEMKSTSKHTVDKVQNIDERIKEINISAETMNQNVNSVAAAAEELSINMSTVSERANESSSNINSVASATEEMNATVSEIAKNAENARNIVEKAVIAVKKANEQVNELGKATRDINNVVSTITEISNQTKLLALNATIEAARAGEAGRGFAVVAEEVKKLANQTNIATTEIKNKVTTMQQATEVSIEEIKNINNVINDVNEMVTSIATSVEEQSITTSDMSASISNAANGIEDMTMAVQEASIALNEITENVSEASAMTSQVASSISEVAKSSKDLRFDSTRLYINAMEVESKIQDNSKLVSQFKLNSDLSSKAKIIDDNLFTFNESWSVNVKNIDSQHTGIFDRINKLHKGIKFNKSTEEMIEILTDLAVYTTKHFKDEEALMKKANHKGLSGHIKIHEKLLLTVGNIIEDLKAGREVDLIGVMVFAKDWVQEHILGTDRKYSKDMNNSGIY